MFTLALEERLRAGAIDGAVHSLKDLPVADPPGLALGAIPARGDVADALIVRGEGGAALEIGRAKNADGARRPPLFPLRRDAVVGTGSLRRAAQLLALRPDLRIVDIRGNVDTRIRKVLDPAGPYDAAVLAVAGLKRLELDALITVMLPFEMMLPAPGQGALAVQCRKEPEWLALFGGIDDSDTRAAVTAERAFLAGLGGGCRAPVAALGEKESGGAADGGKSRSLRLWGRVSAPDGSRQIDARSTGPYSDGEQLGRSLAQSALRRGAQEIIDQIAESEGPAGADLQN